MKQLALLFILVSALTFSTNAQNEINGEITDEMFKSMPEPIYTSMTDEICDSIKDLDMNMPMDELGKKFSAAVNQAYKSHAEKIDIFRQLYIQQKKLNANEVNTMIGKALNKKLAPKCDNFVMINYKSLVSKQSTITTPYFEKISKELCDELKKNKNKSYSELMTLINSNKLSIAQKYEEGIKADYPSGIMDNNFNKELNSYLMENCYLYYKVFFINLQ